MDYHNGLCFSVFFSSKSLTDPSIKVVEYIAFNLLRTYASNTELRGLVDKYDFYIFPVTNPDGMMPSSDPNIQELTWRTGFVYTQTTDRLWRKNRQTTSGSSCLGTDINRNWDYQWSTPGGSSTDPCAQDYRGSAPSSSPENKGLTGYVNGLAQASTGLKLFIDYHSYSQLFMTRKPSSNSYIYVPSRLTLRTQQHTAIPAQSSRPTTPSTSL